MHKKGLNKVDTGAFTQQQPRCFQVSLDEFTCSALRVRFHDLRTSAVNFCVVGLDDESWQQKTRQTFGVRKDSNTLFRRKSPRMETCM